MKKLFAVAMAVSLLHLAGLETAYAQSHESPAVKKLKGEARELKAAMENNKCTDPLCPGHRSGNEECSRSSLLGDCWDGLQHLWGGGTRSANEAKQGWELKYERLRNRSIPLEGELPGAGRAVENMFKAAGNMLGHPIVPLPGDAGHLGTLPGMINAAEKMGEEPKKEAEEGQEGKKAAEEGGPSVGALRSMRLGLERRPEAPIIMPTVPTTRSSSGIVEQLRSHMAEVQARRQAITVASTPPPAGRIVESPTQPSTISQEVPEAAVPSEKQATSPGPAVTPSPASPPVRTAPVPSVVPGQVKVGLPSASPGPAVTPSPAPGPIGTAPTPSVVPGLAKVAAPTLSLLPSSALPGKGPILVRGSGFTPGVGSAGVVIYADFTGAGLASVAVATVGTDGNFATNITIPPYAVAGAKVVEARQGDLRARATFTVTSSRKGAF